MAETVFFDEQGLEFLLSDPEGGVMRDLRRRTENIVREAKANATGRGIPAVRNASFTVRNPEGRGPRIRTGALWDSIHADYDRDEQGPFSIISTDIPYSYYLETGLRNGNTYPFLVPALDAAGE